jgi:hypothetical protein
MLEWYFDVNELLREMRKKAIKAQAFLQDEDFEGANFINSHLKTDCELLQRRWRDQGLDGVELNNLIRHVWYGEANDYRDILKQDLLHVETVMGEHVRKGKLGGGWSEAGV